MRVHLNWHCFNQRLGQLRTHHVNDLLEREPEGEVDGVGLVVDRPLQLVVVAHEVLQEPPLVVTAVGSFGGNSFRAHNISHSFC